MEESRHPSEELSYLQDALRKAELVSYWKGESPAMSGKEGGLHWEMRGEEGMKRKEEREGEEGGGIGR